MSIYELSLIATVIMALAALASAVAAALSARTAKRALAKQTEPEVIVFMDSGPDSESAAHLYVRNIGMAPAYDVSVSVSPDIPMRRDDNAFLDNAIAFLQPGGERRTFLDVFYAQIERMGDTVYTATVKYSGDASANGPSFVREYPIEARSFMWNTSNGSMVAKEIKELNKSIDKIVKAMK